MFKKYFGDKKFYMLLFSVALPIMIQTGITNLVSSLDNIMVGSLGTESMSGVSIVNQFIFIFNLLIFGITAAAGIFTAQYHGYGDRQGETHTFRFKFFASIIATAICIFIFMAFDDGLINIFLNEGTEGDLQLTLEEGKKYLRIILIGLIPFSISQVYSSTMRETGSSITPTVASVSAVITNTSLNFILIFGMLGAPALGVLGAAIATVVSRFVEFLILVIWGHSHTKSTCAFLHGAFASFRISPALVKKIAVKGTPIMLNELLWSIAVTMRNQCYSTRGLEIVAAQNISSTISNLFSVVYISVGSSIAIIIGNLLGAGKLQEAKETDTKIMTFSITSSVFMGGIMVGFSSLFPLLYETTDSVRSLAQYMIIVSAISLPFCAFAHSAYFTLRSGGKVFVTFLFDTVFMWVFVLPVSAVFAYFTSVNIFILFAISQFCEALKTVFGIILLKKVNWLNRMVGENSN